MGRAAVAIVWLLAAAGTMNGMHRSSPDRPAWNYIAAALVWPAVLANDIVR